MTEPTEVQNVTNQTPAETPATAPEQNAAKYTQEQVEQIVKERLEREKKAAEKKAEEARQKAEAEALAKNAEWEKLAKQREEELNKAKELIAKKELDEKKRAISVKVGLPEAFAARLQGATDEELEADAKTLLAALPKQEKPTPGINPTNPGEATNAETKEQINERLFGKKPDFFGGQGGGVFVNKE